MTKFVAGLGNPGRRYDRTRHNVGFLVLDRLAERLQCGPFRVLLKAEYREARIEEIRVLLLKPKTYMNRSGSAVRDILGYFKGVPADLLVVHDDLDLPLGRLRFRARGSSGGHRGVESIIESLGTREFNRLKIGIGRDPSRDPVKHVLAPFEAETLAEVDVFLDRAAEAVNVWIQDGIEQGAQLYNGAE